MDDRARSLISALSLEPHPEGGYFREVHRSEHDVMPTDGRGPRPAMTTILFLVTAGNPSRVHRLRSEEVWTPLAGDPLELHVAAPDFSRSVAHRLGPPGPGADAETLAVVPADHWQAAETAGDLSLVSCVVAPGFTFEDFSMLRDDADARASFEERRPELVHLV